MARNFILSGMGGGCEAVGEKTIISGVPVQTFKRQMLRPGKYVHPVDKWEWEVTPESLEKLCADTNTMLSLGVPVEATVDHSASARDVLGYVTGKLAIEDGVDPAGKPTKWLVGVHEYRGDSAIEVAQRNKHISIEVDAFKDAEGHTFDEVILASSLVQKPVVTGQGGSGRIAASLAGRHGTQVPVLFLSNIGQGDHLTKGNSMNLKELFASLNENLGVKLSEEGTALATLKSFFADRAKKLLALESSPATVDADLAETTASLKAAVEKGQALEAQVTTKSDEVKRLSLQVAAVSMDSGSAEVVAKAYESRIKALETAGKLSPEAGRKVLSVMVGSKGARRKLSISGDAVLVSVPVDEFLDILETNEPKKLGTQTPLQTGNTAIKPGDANLAKTFEQQVEEEAAKIKANKPVIGN